MNMPLFESPGAHTSRLAKNIIERSGMASTHRQICLDYVTRCPGHTAGEITAYVGFEADKRLSELKNNELVRNGENKKCNITGILCMTWYPVEKEGILT